MWSFFKRKKQQRPVVKAASPRPQPPRTANMVAASAAPPASSAEQDARAKEAALLQTGKIRSVVAAGMALKGDIVLQDEGAKIDGRVEGNIRIVGHALLVIGASAVIEGDVFAPNIILAGTVQGSVTGKKIVLTKTARILGLTRYWQQNIQNGAILAGGLVCMPKDDVMQAFPLPTYAGQAALEG